MKKGKLFIAIMLAAIGVSAQNSMGIGTDTPSPNAVVEIVSPSGNQGFLIPRYTTTQRTAATFTDNLTNADNGLMVFDVTEGILYFWYTGEWVPAATEAYVDTNSSPWIPSASNISYELGNVGVGTANPVSAFQVGENFHMFHFLVTSPNTIEGNVIGSNIYFDGTTLRNTVDGPVSFIYMAPDGEIQFLYADANTAESDLLATENINSSLTLKANNHAEFRGAVEIGSVRDSSDIQSGMLAYESSDLYLYDGVEWTNISSGLSLPYQSTVNAATNLFDLENIGDGSVAYFNLNNSAATANAVNIVTNSNNTGSSALYVNNDGNGTAAEFNITGAGNNENAMAARTAGTGTAGYFEITNPSNSNPTLIINSNGLGSAATFVNTNAGSTNNIIEILNSGSGAGLSINNNGSVTSFGELNSTISSSLSITGNHSTDGAVFSNVVQEAGTTRNIQDSDHIIVLTAPAGGQNITLPVSSANLGREIIISIGDYGNITNHTILTQGENINVEGDASPSFAMSSTGLISVTLRSYGSFWMAVETVYNTAAQ
ncbi:hypothetical protein [Marinoscillum pacificum]|uniref:hypothetical protein n=1 Tax=Marinoscillum pacificum TaxID=392723 RepID=UPI0021580C72|nr:hypothetical protein [Marinoscillum pacificum]